jgi:hypothetical protein
VAVDGAVLEVDEFDDGVSGHDLCDVVEGIEPADGVLACFAGAEIVAGLERHRGGGHTTNLTANTL